MRGGPGSRAVLAMVLVGIALAGGASGALAERLPPMRLGVALPDIHVGSDDRALKFPPPRGARSERVCRSWHAMVDRLGETFLAARMRRAVLPSTCPIENADAADHWTWPWDSSGLDGDLPPVTRATIGAWSIRCGVTRARERCSLVQSGQVTERASGRALAFNTHFVIDSVNGKERLVWRLYLHDADPDRDGEIDWHRSSGRAELTVGDFATAAPFSVCSRAGCMLEGDLASGAEIAKRLWDGMGARISVLPPSLVGRPVMFSGEIAARGLRQALPQLTRLRQREAVPIRAARPSPTPRPSHPGETRVAPDRPVETRP